MQKSLKRTAFKSPSLWTLPESGNLIKGTKIKRIATTDKEWCLGTLSIPGGQYVRKLPTTLQADTLFPFTVHWPWWHQSLLPAWTWGLAKIELLPYSIRKLPERQTLISQTATELARIWFSERLCGSSCWIRWMVAELEPKCTNLVRKYFYGRRWSSAVLAGSGAIILPKMQWWTGYLARGRRCHHGSEFHYFNKEEGPDLHQMARHRGVLLNITNKRRLHRDCAYPQSAVCKHLIVPDGKMPDLPYITAQKGYRKVDVVQAGKLLIDETCHVSSKHHRFSTLIGRVDR